MMKVMNLNKYKNLLKEEHKGSQGVESVILAPLMFITFVILLYFCFMSLTFISYNNLANNIAQELNMRQSGYTEAMNKYSTPPRVLTYRNANDGINIPPSAYLPASAITVSPGTSALQSGAYFAIDKHKGQFIIPFSEIKGVKVTTTKAIDPSIGRKLAGTVIKVEIEYTSMVLGKPGSGGLIPMRAVGYNVIS